MKKYILPLLILAGLAAASCEQEMLNEESVIKDSTVEMNDFDYWLEANFLKPYNIEFKYRYTLDESEKGYWTVPADIDASIIYAHLVKYLCVDISPRCSSSSAPGNSRTTVPLCWVPPRPARKSCSPA